MLTLEYCRFDFRDHAAKGAAALRLLNALTTARGVLTEGPDRPVLWTTIPGRATPTLYLSTGAVAVVTGGALVVTGGARLPATALPEGLMLVYGDARDYRSGHENGGSPRERRAPRYDCLTALVHALDRGEIAAGSLVEVPMREAGLESDADVRSLLGLAQRCGCMLVRSGQIAPGAIFVYPPQCHHEARHLH